MPPDAIDRQPRGAARWLVPAALVFGLTVLVFRSALSGEFVNWDDFALVVDNPGIRRLDWESLQSIFTSFILSNYTPVERLSCALDFWIWGLDPFGFHFTNVLLHACNAVLVFLLARWLMRLAWPFPGEQTVRKDSPAQSWGAAVAALAFALHPLRVESVAWVAERRDVLFLFWLLLATLAHLGSVRTEPGSRRRSWLRLAAWGLFALSLLSKASGVALPVVLLLLDYYPLRRFPLSQDGWRRFGACFVEKIPFFVLALAAGLLAIHAQAERGAMISVGSYPLICRIGNAFVALVFYIQKWLIPLFLFPIYPRAPHHPSILQPTLLLSAAWLILVTGWLIARRHRSPGALIAWASFLVMILPFSGLLQAGNAMAADRYTLLPMIPLTILAGAGFSWLAERWSGAERLVLVAVTTIVLLAWSELTVRQIRVWRNSTTLWEHALREVPHEFIPLGNYSSALVKEKRYFLARTMAREALWSNSRSDVAWFNLGIAAAHCGLTNEAIGALDRAARLNPGAGDSHFELAKLLHRAGRFHEALAHYFAAVQAEPSTEHQINLAMALDDAGHPAMAVKFLVQATLRGDSKAYLVWASILIHHGEYDRARALLALGYRFTGDPALRILRCQLDAQPRKPTSSKEPTKPGHPSPKKRPAKR
jgi:hypothetical protein